MKSENFSSSIRSIIIPKPEGEMKYRCLGCINKYDSSELLYTCPSCGSVLLLEETSGKPIAKADGNMWRDILDYRRMLNTPSIKGIFRFHEFIAPIIPLEHIVYLGEGHTPLVEANDYMKSHIGMDFYFKNDGLNPSASFKDRGMACAVSYINYQVKSKNIPSILAVCASTGDTSASAALYASYLNDSVKSAVLLPKGKVTPQQLAQPLGSGAQVFEIPGVFDDCMKVVEHLSEVYNVVLLNSKNPWRILGQESFSFEIAQDLDWNVDNTAVVVPIGNAGNITAVMSGFIKFYEASIINNLPKIIGVQSEHADPVFRYYQQEEGLRVFQPVTVRDSVAQAAMIGNPVSMPRVIELVDKYNELSGRTNVFIVQVSEQEIMDTMIVANRNGNIACTQGAESLAGLKKALNNGVVSSDEVGIVDSTAHSLKFSVFQNMYFTDTFAPSFEIKPDHALINMPHDAIPEGLSLLPKPGQPLKDDDMKMFVEKTSEMIAESLKLERR